ncbi:lectin like domain-containing protein [Holdemanella biformis]|uniref:lectin like domain-containing protein n=1 Tax=Holdemanella biformis TaxID=1735 RepID=UPI0026DBDBFA|nr:C1 family peptidase [Holdemanella biformis]
MKTNKCIAVLLSLLMGFNTLGVCYAEEVIDPSTDGSSHTFGDVISEYADDVPYYESEVDAYADIPTRYELDKNLFPDVRNQNPYGTCWAFAALGLSEFDLIKRGLANKSIDLSELQLAYFVYNSALDPLGGTEGDQSKYYNGSTSYSYLNRGGTYEYAVRRLSQWSGAVNESDVPYNTTTINNVLENGLSDEYAYSKDVAHLENAYVMSLKNNPDDVKRVIMLNGAVGIQYYHSDNYLLWNSDKQLWTYYDPNITGGGHNVMIVGWDDDFSKDNFVGDKPTNNGAWLIRNSWGFQQEYFWMSYENKSLLDAAWAFDMNTADNYDNNYQLDGGINSFNVTNNITPYKAHSNVFTVPNKDGISSETLKAVSLSFTHVADVNYKIEVYTDLKNNNPYSGTKQDTATVEDSTTYAGLYTIELNDTIELKPGSSFAVVVTTDKYALDFEQGINWESNGTKVWDAPVSLGGGKSFSGTDKYQWPWNYGNFCVKAFTTNNYKQKKDISNAVITKKDDFSEDNPSVNVTYDNLSLKQNVDYTLTSINDENGITVTINGQGDYTGTSSKMFIPISNLNIKCKDVAYTGSEVKPEVTVKSDVGTLTENVDYSLSYSNNKNVGEDAVVTIKGLNDYYGTKDVKFQIYNDIGENLKRYSLSLNGLIEFNFYFNLSDALANDKEAYVLFTMPDGRQSRQYVKDANRKNDMYGFTCGLYAKEMTQKVIVQVVNGKGMTGYKYAYAVEDYANYVLNSSESSYERAKPVIKTMMNYGGYAQDEFNAYLDNKAYKDVKNEFKQELESISASDFSDYAFKELSKDQNFSSKSISLILEEATTLRFYIYVKDSSQVSSAKVTVDGLSRKIEKNNKGYFVDVPSIKSNKLNEVHNIQINDLKVECSALTYMNIFLNYSKNETDIAVTKALYIYYLRSKEYFG